MTKNSSPLLYSRKFLPLFITQFFGAFNDNVFKNAFLIWFTYDMAAKLDMSAPIMVTVASALFILPFFLFSALAGQIADKYEKSRLVQIIKIAEILIMIFCFIGFYFENIYLLLALLFLMGTHSTFFGPIKYSLLPEHLRENELVSGNALIEGGTFLAILLGTIFGGIVIRREYGVEIISIAVILFAVVGWLSSLAIPRSIASDVKLKISFNIITQTWKIINYARKEKTVWRALIGISWLWFIGITFLSQFPVYTKNIIRGDEFIVTLFLAIFSVGIGIGSVMCNKLLKGKITARLVPVGLIGITVGIFIFCAASYFYDMSFIGSQNLAGANHLISESDQLIGLNYFLSSAILNWFIILGLLTIAISSGIYVVPLYALMQQRSEAKYLSRIIAANNVFNALFMIFASLVAAILFSLHFNVLEIFLVVGIANLFLLKL